MNNETQRGVEPGMPEFMAEVWEALKSYSNDLRKQRRILLAARVLLAAQETAFKERVRELIAEIGEKPTEDEITDMPPYRQGMVDGTARVVELIKHYLPV